MGFRGAHGILTSASYEVIRRHTSDSLTGNRGLVPETAETPNPANPLLFDGPVGSSLAGWVIPS